MSRLQLAPAFALALLLSGCIENTAPGNDREAELAPPEPPAEVVDVAAATAGVATDMLIPQTITDADLRNAPDVGEPCMFHFTKVGLPVFLYGSVGVMKLNGKLVELPAVGINGPVAEGRRYAAGPVTVTVRPLEDAAPESGEPYIAQLVLQRAGASHELGYHGFAECERPGA